MFSFLFGPIKYNSSGTSQSKETQLVVRRHLSSTVFENADPPTIKPITDSFSRLLQSRTNVIICVAFFTSILVLWAVSVGLAVYLSRQPHKSVLHLLRLKLQLEGVMEEGADSAVEVEPEAILEEYAELAASQKCWIFSLYGSICCLTFTCIALDWQPPWTRRGRQMSRQHIFVFVFSALVLYGSVASVFSCAWSLEERTVLYSLLSVYLPLFSSIFFGVVTFASSGRTIYMGIASGKKAEMTPKTKILMALAVFDLFIALARIFACCCCPLAGIALVVPAATGFIITKIVKWLD